MNTSLGYSKRTLDNTKVLLSGGGDKLLSDFIGSISWDAENRKLKYTPVGGTATDLVTFGSNALSNTVYVAKGGDTMTGTLTVPELVMYGGTSGTRKFSFTKTINNCNIDIGWNWANKDGAGMALRSADSESGSFVVWARDGSGTCKQLIGRVNGTLTWDSSKIITAANIGSNLTGVTGISFANSKAISIDGYGNIKLPTLPEEELENELYWHINTSSGGLILAADKTGNVGIGKKNPTSKLDVNGKISATLIEASSYVSATTLYENNTSLISKYVSLGTEQTITAKKIFKVSSPNTESVYYNIGLCLASYGDSTKRVAAIGLANESLGWYKAAIGFERTNSYDRGNIVFLLNSVQDSTSCAYSDIKVRINASGDITTDGALGMNNSTFVGKLTPTTLTANRTYTLPDDTGTVALTKNIPTKASWNYDDTYVKLSGSTITGALKRYYGTASDDPMIALTSNNLDVWLWRINHGTSALTSTSAVYGFGLKYLGTGGSNDNKLVLYSDAQNGTLVAAMTVLLNGEISFTNAPKVGTNVIYHAGNLPAYPTKASWNYDDVYVKSVSISGDNLRINKNGSNTDLTIPFATNANTALVSNKLNIIATINGQNTANYPWRLIAKREEITTSYVDTEAVIVLRQFAVGGKTGTIKIAFRTNEIATTASGVAAVWLDRFGFNVDDIKIAVYWVANKSYADVFLKAVAWSRMEMHVIGNRSWSFVSSSEGVDGSSPVNAYASIEAAATALHGRAYTNIFSAQDGGIVSYANSAGAAAKDSDGNAINSTYLKLSGGTISNTAWGQQLTLKRQGGTPSLYFDNGSKQWWFYPSNDANNVQKWYVGTNLSGADVQYEILTGINSSVSKSGETLTVKINGTSQSLTNTWRGITDSYSDTSSTTSLSQKGGNALYNALLNGYASTAGDADTLDSWHRYNILQTGYVTSAVSGLTSYWAKAWTITVTNKQYVDQDAVMLLDSAYNRRAAIILVKIRQTGANGSGAYNFDFSVQKISGNIPNDVVRLSVNNSTGVCELWLNTGGQYNNFNITILKKNNNRYGHDCSALGTLTTSEFTTAQSVPALSTTCKQMEGVSQQVYDLGADGSISALGSIAAQGTINVNHTGTTDASVWVNNTNGIGKAVYLLAASNRGVYVQDKGWLITTDGSNTSVGIGDFIPANSVVPNSDNSKNLGSTSKYWQNVYHYNSCVWEHVNVGYQLGHQSTNRAEIALISRTNVPCDLMLGANSIKKWSITCRESSSSYKLGVYSYSSNAMAVYFNGTTIEPQGNIENTYYKLSASSSNPYLKLNETSPNTRTWYIQGYQGYLYLGSESAKSLRVDSDGGLSVPTYVNIGYKLGQRVANRAELAVISTTDVPGDIYLGSSNAVKWQISSRASSDSNRLVFYGNNASTTCLTINTAGDLTSAGNIYATNFYTTSDARMKKDISSISEHVRKFKLKLDDSIHYGFIAQEVEVEHPELVDNSGDHKTVDYNSTLSLLLAKAENKIKELENRIKLLEDGKNS